MHRIAHVSDIHFGREDPLLVQALVAALHAVQPESIVVSGDLTQRARVSQFRQAREFLDALPKVPTLVVPGNHDVSTTNLMERFTRPLSRYRRYITREMAPFLEDEQVAIAGINTVRVLSTKDGRVNHGQVGCACDRLNGVGDERVRVVVTHHPMDLPMEDTHNALVQRSAMAMTAFAGCKVDLFLSGHLHTGQTVTTSRRYGIAGWSAIVAQAGTAVSTRTRGEANSWNVIHIERSTIGVQEMVWETGGGEFRPGPTSLFEKGDSGWERR